MSSIIGLAAVIWWVRRSYLAAPVASEPARSPSVKLRKVAVFLLLIPPLVFGISISAYMLKDGALTYQVLRFTKEGIIYGGRLFLFIWLGLGAYYWWLAKRQK